MNRTPTFHRCFLSYNYKDEKFVKKLGKDLLRCSVDVWVDEWEIQAGDSITGKMSEGLRRCNIFLIILSKNSMKSDWVKEELRTALYRRVKEKKFRIIPVLYQQCDIQELSMLLPDLNYIDFRYKKNYSQKFQELLNSIRQSTDKPQLILNGTDFADFLKNMPDNYRKKNAIYYQALASDFIQSGEYSKAIPYLEKSISFNPSYSSSYFDLAYIHVRLGQYEKALPLYEKVVEFDSNHSSAWFDLAIVNARLGRYEKAKLYYQKVLELDSSHSTAYHDLGLISYRLLQYEDALEYYMKHLEFEPQNFQVRLICSDILIKLKRFDEAEKFAKDVLQYDPDNIEAREIISKINIRLVAKLLF